MARFALVALCVTATVCGALATSPSDYGMTMGARAFDAICWYETLKTFPETNSKGFGQCGTTSSQLRSQIDDPNGGNAQYFKTYPDKKGQMFGQFLKDMGMGKLPQDYQSKCNKYLEEANIGADPPADENDALNSDADIDYPLKAFANCMMKTLREKHGDAAIEAVKNERTHSLKNWMQTLLDRENEFRARHGAKPLKLDKKLVEAAQEWADDNAKKCKMYHSENKDPRRQWHGKGTGESLSSGGGPDERETAAYQAADGWYEEIKDYPFPTGYSGDGNDALFKKIGHFTQSVWDESEYVGYGYAYNGNCKPMTRYVAARYSPAGNSVGHFTEHVHPPK